MEFTEEHKKAWLISKPKVEDSEHVVLKDKPTVVTKASFWKIPHDSGKSDISIKIGRYNKIKNGPYTLEEPEVKSPKSELTLDNEEFLALIKLLSEKYEPFKLGIKRYISLDESFSEEGIDYLKGVFSDADKQKVVQLIHEHNILPDDLVSALTHIEKVRAVKEFEAMLQRDLLEKDWQDWFLKNSWVLGSDFVKVLDEREIDTKNISDYLMEAYDGFLDIIEIKRPEGTLKFWADSLDHGNYYPSVDLTKAITQSNAYVHEVELEADSDKFLKRVGHVRVIKPRCTLIFGRSKDWNDEQREAYRILNCAYHSLTILTYDHILERAKRMVGLA